MESVPYNPKVVLAHDSLTQIGGAEKVVDMFHLMYPDAPLHVLLMDKKYHDRYRTWNIHTTWLQRLYNIYPRFQRLLPFIPFAAKSVNIQHADVLLSSSSGFAKAFRISKPGIHINYCHTPTRFLWSDSQYVAQEVPAILKPFAKVFLSWMKRWDYAMTQKIDFLIANSKEVQNRIKHYYNRESEIIYPGIDTAFWYPSKPKQDYFLVAGRLQAHKHNELIIEIFNELGLPLHVVGIGRQEEYLRSIAKPHIKFLGRVVDEVLRDEYSGARAFMYPQLEDFGLMPLEAAACGTATIGLAKGGSLETVIPGVTGELFTDYNKDTIKKIILEWNAEKYQPPLLRAHAEKFDVEVFKKKIQEFVISKVQK